jgi:hypothetical protein
VAEEVDSTHVVGLLQRSGRFRFVDAHLSADVDEPSGHAHSLDTLLEVFKLGSNNFVVRNGRRLLDLRLGEPGSRISLDRAVRAEVAGFGGWCRLLALVRRKPFELALACRAFAAEEAVAVERD